MRKFTLILAFVVLVVGCRENETPDPPSTETRLSDLAAAATTTETAVEPLTSTTDLGIPERPDPATSGEDETKYEYLVDTFYDWPVDVRRVTTNEFPGVGVFVVKNAEVIIKRRERAGYTATWQHRVRGVANARDPFNYPRIVVGYRKPR